MKRRNGFTLVELLTVIAIISVLIALLLPALKAARRQVDKTACASNLRQIGMALLLYAQDHKGWLPQPAVWRYGSDRVPEDWVYWHKGRDLNQSRIRPYLSNFKVLVCPSGLGRSIDLEQVSPDNRFVQDNGLYPFSYSINPYLTGIMSPPVSYGPSIRYWESGRRCNLQKVVQPWHKLMVVEEDSLTINDGAWDPYGDGTPVMRSSGHLSARHDLGGEKPLYDRVIHDYESALLAKVIGSGHGICADGSYLWVDRDHSRHSPYYTHPLYPGPINPPKGWEQLW